MIRKTLFTIFVLTLGTALAGAAVTPSVPDQLVPSRENREASIIITRVVENHHYKKVPLDDELSASILDRYIKSLDPNRSFFLEKDIDTFSIYRDRLDDDLQEGRLEPAFNIFRIYRVRVKDRVDYALRLLSRKFDFGVDEDYLFDRTEAPWPKNRAELDELWRKRVKNDILGLRLAGKPEKEILDTLRKRYEGVLRRVNQTTADEISQTFVNAYTYSVEPHTAYMLPSTSENFDISMRLSLEGIGAVLRTENEYTVVERVVPGGPAELSGQLHSKDRIVGVGQGTDEIEDVVGWRLQDVVSRIRGPKGSVVRLRVLPKKAGADGPPRTITLVRNKIKLEDQAAKLSVIEHLGAKDNRRIGVIEVPAFYRDFRAEANGDKNFRSTTRDVHALLNELKQDGVDGVVIDLRGNGGGSLTEAVELTGLFIEEGPVVQVRNAEGRIEVENDEDPSVVYTGPLAVLVDDNSASASEIFAGAIQDYGRGIIVGEPTFGKGTVQTLVDLDRFLKHPDTPLGRLKLTMAQFFRVNGGSTQHRGVVPDIVFPTASDSPDKGERSLENALPWARVMPVSYTPQNMTTWAWLGERHEARIKKDPGFRYLSKEAGILSELSDQKVVSLLESKRRAEWDRRRRDRLASRNEFRQSRGEEPLPADFTEDPDLDEEDAKAIRQAQLEETARILADLVDSRRPMAAMR
jgi:carboxyl-terminal processing protease